MLDENWKKTWDDFEEKIMFLHGKYGLSITPKMHILLCHFEEYIKLTGKPLGYVSDQTVEMCHQIVNNRFTKSNYYVKAVESDKHGENLLRGVLHVNSYNI